MNADKHIIITTKQREYHYAGYYSLHVDPYWVSIMKADRSSAIDTFRTDQVISLVIKQD